MFQTVSKERNNILTVFYKDSKSYKIKSAFAYNKIVSFNIVVALLHINLKKVGFSYQKSGFFEWKKWVFSKQCATRQSEISIRRQYYNKRHG